ncbi:hypothetical protein K1T71_007407 [Dendrolimus kikuchii]|uniref:Uncharacterized protein n=1 Tax=Dendrolimus kikuchii TaxID=765133 RepID=A0ACC1D0E4_9NEOP|nr:hypothetical protein K1T71_007407 [Dendrolimus kikuchii]
MFKTIIIAMTLLVVLVESRSLIVGETYEQSGTVRKVYSQTYEATGIILTKRKKYIHFEYEANQKIKGIAIRDLDNGLAEPAITSGGLNFNYVDIKLKSQRGSGFNYLVEIYA